MTPMMMNDDDDFFKNEPAFTKKDVLKCLACVVFLILLFIGMLFLFVWVVELILSLVGWAIWGI